MKAALPPYTAFTTPSGHCYFTVSCNEVTLCYGLLFYLFPPKQNSFSPCVVWFKSTVEEKHGILTCNGWMFSMTQFHFQFKSVNISTILTSKLKCVCMFGDLILDYHLAYIFTVCNEVAKVMFLHVSVSHSLHRVGVLSQNALQVVSQHALQQGVPAPGGCLFLGGCLLRGGLLLGGVGVCADPPESRRLLLQTVRILLECILVLEWNLM